jgi:hypothetical protein
MNNYVVYFHRNPISGEVFYVGSGSPKRPYAKGGRTAEWKNYVKQIDAYKIEVYKTYLSKFEAKYLESHFIKVFGRRNYEEGGTLINKCKYGNDRSGYKHTDSAKAKISLIHSGKPKTAEHIEKIRSRLKGRIPLNRGIKMSDEARRKMSEARRKRITKDSTRQKMSLARKGAKNPNSRKVVDDATGNEFLCAKDAASAYNISISYLSQMLNGRILNKTTLRFL